MAPRSQTLPTRESVLAWGYANYDKASWTETKWEKWAAKEVKKGLDSVTVAAVEEDFHLWDHAEDDASDTTSAAPPQDEAAPDEQARARDDDAKLAWMWIFDFGQYAGETLMDIYRKDKPYVQYLIDHVRTCPPCAQAAPPSMLLTCALTSRVCLPRTDDA